MKWEQLSLYVIALGVVYTWAGYPALLWLAGKFWKRPIRRGDGFPSISVIVAVRNEEAQMAAKLENCLGLDYPPDKLEIIVASDHSTDRTEQIVEEFARRHSKIRLLRSVGRAGKSGVQNQAVEAAGGEILVFTDAETRAWSTLLGQMAEDFADPAVGLVAPVVHFGQYENSVSKGQSAYWRYELFLRQLESDIGILATASGSALAVRRCLYRPIPPQYGDDCVIPLDVRLQGYRVVQEARAIVYDRMPHSVEGELRARVRMTARNWTGMLARNGLLSPLHFPGTSWGLISHKFLRWMTPFFLAALFLINGLLALQGKMVFLAALQICFYVAALVGWRRSRRTGCERIFGYPFAFCLANLGFFLGTWKSLRGERVEAYK
jgi:cellulose synthase/poly-beta-1,6-N-acetylglucosamine synthase-like glycosyltransferase